jgi:cytochrome c oxidase subunit 2
MLLAPIVWVLTIVICYFFVARTWWFPPPINDHGRAFDAQFLRTLIVVGILFFVAQFALGWVMFRFRGKGAPARFIRGNHRLETVWTFAVAALFLGLVAMGSKIWASVHYDEAPPDAIPIEVMAKQFAFNFRYPGPDGKFGRTQLRLINDANGDPFGLDPADPAGNDDILSATLKIPVGKPIKLLLHSRDVIHNFFVPELRIKQDIVPGMEIPLHFQADQVGVYEVPCSELCGLGHFQMHTTMQVMSAAEFERWKSTQAAR